MFQRITTWFFVAILGLVPLTGTVSTTLAQNESGFPTEIAVNELALGDVPPSITAPGILTLERIKLPSKAGLPVREVPTIEILYAEEGTLTIADGLGLSSQLAAEKSVTLRAGASYTAINDGSGDVSYLRLSLVALGNTATPIAATVPQPEASDTVEVVALAEFELTAIPTSPTILFLSRATWGPGVDSGEYTQTGPIGFYTESGSLTISSPSGIDGQLDEGKAVLLPADTVLRTRNDGSSDAVALLFGIIPADGPAVTAGTTTDASLQEDASEVAATTSGVLYEANSSTGFEDWSKSGGWQTVSGMFVNDGRGEGLFNAVPFEIPVADYAIEVEMQWARGENGYSFGVIAREISGEGYFAGYGDNSCEYDGRAICLWGASYGPIGETDLKLDSEWHIYRLEVYGNTVRVFVDGSLVIETTDNSYLSAGRAGLWSDGSQVNVRRFSVISLGDN